MTRINIIPASELADQHLIAEYREITMVPAALERTLKSKLGLQKERISKKYTLNTGHVYFFYDKGLYLDNRYQEIVVEMKSRGFSPDPNRKFPKEVFGKHLYNDWLPSLDEQRIIRQRIQEKINMKPDWYRYTTHQ
jgi:deoxyribonuclease (pyrimidine dimer)